MLISWEHGKEMWKALQAPMSTYCLELDGIASVSKLDLFQGPVSLDSNG